MMLVGLTVNVVILVLCCYTTVCMVGVCIDVHNMCAIDTELQEFPIMIPVEVFMPDVGFLKGGVRCNFVVVLCWTTSTVRSQ